ncbi:MAG: P-loop NTPase family protein [Oscillatoriales cyanobacterium]|nr:MAG: P-loop NTPase family protein [Oscillatoriales cyanobacterium]
MVSQLEVSALPLAPDAIARGLVQVFATPDRTFLTDVMAQALRVAGQGQAVLVVQFLKGGIRQGGDRPISLVQRLEWLRCDLTRHLDRTPPTAEEISAIRDLWQQTIERSESGQYELIVLDELSLAVEIGAIDCQEVLDFLDDRPGHVDVILTGPSIPPQLLDAADQITEVRRSRRS